MKVKIDRKCIGEWDKEWGFPVLAIIFGFSGFFAAFVNPYFLIVTVTASILSFFRVICRQMIREFKWIDEDEANKS